MKLPVLLVFFIQSFAKQKAGSRMEAVGEDHRPESLAQRIRGLLEEREERVAKGAGWLKPLGTPRISVYSMPICPDTRLTSRVNRSQFCSNPFQSSENNVSQPRRGSNVERFRCLFYELCSAVSAHSSLHRVIRTKFRPTPSDLFHKFSVCSVSIRVFQQGRNIAAVWSMKNCDGCVLLYPHSSF